VDDYCGWTVAQLDRTTGPAGSCSQALLKDGQWFGGPWTDRQRRRTKLESCRRTDSGRQQTGSRWQPSLSGQASPAWPRQWPGNLNGPDRQTLAMSPSEVLLLLLLILLLFVVFIVIVIVIVIGWLLWFIVVL
jgi:hypothetical protein